MSGKSILQKVFDSLQLSIDADVNCELTPRQCKALLEREEILTQTCDHYTDKVSEMNKELARLRGLLELERSDE